MIRDFEITQIQTAVPPDCKNIAEMYGIKTIFLIKRSFSFSSVTLFQDLATWIQGIKDGNIFPLFDNKEYVDDSDADPLEPNGQNYLYLRYKGKYKFVHNFNYNYEYAKNIKGISQGDFDYIFVTRNGQIVAYSPDGIKVQGFETDSITVLPLRVGTTQKANFVTVNVELSEADQLDLNAEVFKPGWSISQNLRLVAVDFFNVELSSLTFEVKDRVFGKPISHLMKSNIILDDQSGAISFNKFVNLGDGKYHLDDFSSPPGSGEIQIDSRIYYGFGTYGAASIATVNVFAFAITGPGGYFWIRLTDPGGFPINGRSQSQFSFDAGTINFFNDYADGVYLIGLVKATITNGSVTFNDGNYNGVSLYDFTGQYLNDNFSVLRQSSTRYFSFPQNGASVDGLGSYLPEAGAWRIITGLGGDFFYIYWNKIINGVNNRISINIQAISAGELKFENGSNVQSFTTSGVKSFDWTGDGNNLTMFTNSVNCLISDLKIETF